MHRHPARNSARSGINGGWEQWCWRIGWPGERGGCVSEGNIPEGGLHLHEGMERSGMVCCCMAEGKEGESTGSRRCQGGRHRGDKGGGASLGVKASRVVDLVAYGAAKAWPKQWQRTVFTMVEVGKWAPAPAKGGEAG